MVREDIEEQRQLLKKAAAQAELRPLQLGLFYFGPR